MASHSKKKIVAITLVFVIVLVCIVVVSTSNKSESVIPVQTAQDASISTSTPKESNPTTTPKQVSQTISKPTPKSQPVPEENVSENGSNDLLSDEAVVSAAGKLTTLPEGKVKVRVVTDAALLKSDPAYASVYALAENGDYLLIYMNTLIIYRQSTDKVINVANVPNILSQFSILPVDDNTDVNAIISAVRGLTYTPPDIPQVYIVDDVDVLKMTHGTQRFYNMAQNGDYVLIFSQQSVLYRQSTNTIITTGGVR